MTSSTAASTPTLLDRDGRGPQFDGRPPAGHAPDESFAAAQLVARRGVVAASTFGQGKEVEGVVLVAVGASSSFDDEKIGPSDVEVILQFDDDSARRSFTHAAASDKRVFLFDDAKTELTRLLSRGVDVARPMCRRTLRRLTSQGRARGASGDAGEASESRSQENAPHPAVDADAALARARDLASSCRETVGAVGEVGHHKVARLECLVLRPFAALQARGMPIDVAQWRVLVNDAKMRAATARTKFFEAMGDEVPRDLFGEPDLSLENDADVKTVFERMLGAPLNDLSKYTVARIEHPAANALLRYREANKIVSTYGDAFLEHARDGRIFAEFVPLGASTGRVASREPNLQNLPSDARFHHCLRAKDGFVLVTADYATCELRILADLSGDAAFLDAFAKGHDLHSAVASRLFSKKVTKEEHPELRARAKAINFGLCYGMGAAALASSLELSQPDAEALLARYFDAFPDVARYLDESVDEALRKGYAETVLGRKLVFDPEVVRGPNARGELGRIAKNMPIQGTSADMTKLAMVRVHERLLAEFPGAGLVNTIHDELVVECREVDGAAVAEAVREEMAEAHRTLLSRAPPSVDVNLAQHWAH